MRAWSLLVLSLLAFSALGCAERTDAPAAPETLSSLAERFASDLAQTSGKALAPWFRTDHVVLVTRRCPDCPPEARERVIKLGWGDDAIAFGSRLSTDQGVELDPVRYRLRAGAVSCEARCCRWEVGLLDHGASHLEEACFERDSQGGILTHLRLIDG